jgi:hypothetical protein
MPDLKDGLEGEEEVVWYAGWVGVLRFRRLVTLCEGEGWDGGIVGVGDGEESVGAREEYGMFFDEDFVSLDR